MAVLGLVTTKSPRRETTEELTARLRAASRYLPLERLALSPQCGFASSVLGNRLSPRDQERKLRALARTAEEVWPQEWRSGNQPQKTARRGKKTS